MSVIQLKRKTKAQLNKAKLADFLEVVAGHIRSGQLLHDPHGLVLVLA